MATRGQRRHYVTLQNPGAKVPDGEGGYTETPVQFAQRYAEIKPATVRDLERLAPGTVQSTATHIVTFDYHADVSTKTEIVFNERVLTVSGVINPDERNIDTVCICSEVVA